MYTTALNYRKVVIHHHLPQHSPTQTYIFTQILLENMKMKQKFMFLLYKFSFCASVGLCVYFSFISCCVYAAVAAVFASFGLFIYLCFVIKSPLVN